MSGLQQNKRSLCIEKWNKGKDGPLTISNMKKKLLSQGFSPCQYTFGPNTVFPDHTHAVTKKDSIFSGRFKFCMYGDEAILEAGDMVLVPANTVHNASVVGDEDVVFFDGEKQN